MSTGTTPTITLTPAQTDMSSHSSGSDHHRIHCFSVSQTAQGRQTHGKKIHKPTATKLNPDLTGVSVYTVKCSPGVNWDYAESNWEDLQSEALNILALDQGGGGEAGKKTCRLLPGVTLGSSAWLLRSCEVMHFTTRTSNPRAVEKKAKSKNEHPHFNSYNMYYTTSTSCFL